MLRRLLLALLFSAAAAGLAAQNRTDRRISTARAYISSREFSRADTALQVALDSADYLMDSVHVFVWRSILEHFRGNDSLARVNVHAAVRLYPPLHVNGLDQVAPGLEAVFESESRGQRVYAPGEVDQPATWRSGPSLAYPPELRRRRVSGQAIVVATIDTTGHVEPESFRVIDVPDSAFVEPLRRMMLDATFAPARLKGQIVRSRVDLNLTLAPPPPRSPTGLVNGAREQLRAHRADSALALTDEALDAANGATPAERVFAELVRGVALTTLGKDSLAEASVDSGLGGYRDLVSRGVDLAPFLKRLADSIRLSRRPKPAAPPPPFAAPTALDAVDAQPSLVSHPPIRYAPEMQALRIGGTVVVEATLDTSGHIAPASARVVQSPNPVFDAEARRVVEGSVYRPARVNGRPVRVTIRQAITFAAY